MKLFYKKSCSALINQLSSSIFSPDVQHEDRSNEEQRHDQHWHRSAANTHAILMTVLSYYTTGYSASKQYYCEWDSSKFISSSITSSFPGHAGPGGTFVSVPFLLIGCTSTICTFLLRCREPSYLLAFLCDLTIDY